MDTYQVQQQDSGKTNNSALPVELAEQLVGLIQAAHRLSGATGVWMRSKRLGFVGIPNGAQRHGSA